VKGNFHARFLGGKEAVKSLTYPTQWEVYKQFNRLTKPKREYGIDELIPTGI
jgi:hypothetical protein